MTKVFTNGCFDIIHAGHVSLLESAAELGDYLVVGLNSDASVKELKGKDRPLQTFALRKYALESIRFVDSVIEVDSVNMVKAIKEIKPNVWIKGGDYTPLTLDKEEVEAAKSVGARIVLVPVRFKIHTTALLHA